MALPVVSWTQPARNAGDVWRPSRVCTIDGVDVSIPRRDAVFHRYTRQSTRIAEVPPLHELLFMLSTEREAAPWWEIDLGAAMHIDALTIELHDVPAGTRVSLSSFTFATPSGEPPPGSTFHEQPAGRVELRGVDRIARNLRVTLHAPEGESVALSVRSCEILAADLFAPTLRGTMQRAFALHRDRTLFLEPAAATYGDIWSRAMALGRGLAARLERDDAARTDGRIFVAVCTKNRPEWIVADQAILARGYVSVPMAPDDGDERTARILALARPGCIVCEADHLERLARLSPATRLFVVCDAAAPLDGPRARFEDLVAEGRGLTVPAPSVPREDELYSVLFTSGSTGTPRGAMRTYATFNAMLATYGAGQPARHLSFQPLSHLSERMFLPGLLVHGATIAFSRGGAHLMEELRAFEPTLLGSVPRLFDVLYASYQRRVRAGIPEAQALAEARLAFGRNLQSLSVGSAPCSPEVLAFLRRCFSDIWVTEGYGSTEVGTIAVDGRIQAHVEVKLVPRPDDAAPPGAPERGEIWVRSPHAIEGYLGDVAATAAAIDRDGFFATGDLGERAADGTVRVIGRLRNAVKLAQGEFVSAERVEAALSTADVVDRIYIHATPGAPGIAALVVPARSAPTHEILAALRLHGRRAGLSPWELPRGVVIADAPPTIDNGLLTASGKLARSAIDRVYGARLSALAAGAPPDDTSPAPATGDSLAHRIAHIVSRTLGRSLTLDEPLAAAGVDSLAAAEILAALTDDLHRDIPLSLWFEAATVDDLAFRLESFADPGVAPALRAQALSDLVVTGDGVNLVNFAPRLPLRRVLLTGATGFLGRNLLEELQRTPLEIVCLVRAPDDDAANAKLTKLTPSPVTNRVRGVAGDLAKPRLGLAEEAFAGLAEEVDGIVHAGAVVSWLAPYAGVRGANIEGTRTLLELAAAGGRTRPFHFVSTISTAPATGDETTMLDEQTALTSSPYVLSKWIAEQHVRRAAAAGLPVAIYRPALIAGHSVRGDGNRDDFLHRYLAGVAELGLYLDLDDAILDMTPVDFVARAIVALLSAAPLGNGAAHAHHLANVDQSMSYARLGRALVAAGIRAEPATYERFRAALVAARSSRLAALAAFFPATGFTLGSGPWPCARTVATLAQLGVTRPPIDDALIARYVRASVEIGPK